MTAPLTTDQSDAERVWKQAAEATRRVAELCQRIDVCLPPGPSSADTKFADALSALVEALVLEALRKHGLVPPQSRASSEAPCISHPGPA